MENVNVLHFLVLKIQSEQDAFRFRGINLTASWHIFFRAFRGNKLMVSDVCKGQIDRDLPLYMLFATRSDCDGTSDKFCPRTDVPLRISCHTLNSALATLNMSRISRRESRVQRGAGINYSRNRQHMRSKHGGQIPHRNAGNPRKRNEGTIKAGQASNLSFLFQFVLIQILCFGWKNCYVPTQSFVIFTEKHVKQERSRQAIQREQIKRGE